MACMTEEMFDKLFSPNDFLNIFAYEATRDSMIGAKICEGCPHFINEHFSVEGMMFFDGICCKMHRAIAHKYSAICK